MLSVIDFYRTDICLSTFLHSSFHHSYLSKRLHDRMPMGVYYIPSTHVIYIFPPYYIPHVFFIYTLCHGTPRFYLISLTSMFCAVSHFSFLHFLHFRFLSVRQRCQFIHFLCLSLCIFTVCLSQSRVLVCFSCVSGSRTFVSAATFSIFCLFIVSF